jgi:hypothetical protein
MANNQASLGAIKTLMTNARRLTLDENILGADCFKLLRRLFRQQVPSTLTNCTILEDAETYLICSGTYDTLLSWRSVSVKIALLDLPASPETRVRHCVFRVDEVPEDNVYSFLDKFVPVDTSGSPLARKLSQSLGDYIQTASFSQKAMVFSSVNYAAIAPVLPSGLKALALDSSVPVEAGVSFLVNLALDEDLQQYVENLFGKLDDPSKNRGLIYSGQHGLDLMFRKSITASQTFGDFIAEFQGLSVSFSVDDDEAGPQIGLDGGVRIGTETFSIRAEFDPYSETLAVSFCQFPSLKKIIDLLGKEFQETYFGEPFSSLLALQLAKLAIVLSLSDKSVSEISLSVKSERDLVLIENLVSFRPLLDIRIVAPSDSERRSIEGELAGTWQLGGAGFETALYYPSFRFTAEMAAGQTIDAGTALESVLAEIHLPELHPRITKIEVFGNFLSKSFSFEISVDDNARCTFSIAGRSFGFQIRNVLMTYEDSRLNYAMDGTLVLSGVDLLLSASYDADQGWVLTGGTAAGAKISLGRIVNELLESIAFPTKMPALELVDVSFSAAPKAGEYSLSGRTEGVWGLTDNLSLTVEEFAAEKALGLSVAGRLRTTLAIGGTVIRLSAQKAAAANGGWKFEGSSIEGKEIKIGEIVSWVGERFGKTQLPEAIKEFTVDKLKLSFESESKDFFFTCEGKVTLPRQKTQVQGTVTIDIKHQGESDYTKLFAGSLTIDGIEFDLIFESSKTVDENAKIFVAAYHDANGHTIKIDEIINRFIEGTSAKTGLDITLKDALFACRKTDKEAKYLFGLDIEGGLNLSELNLPNLPLIGQPFAAGQTLKLALQVLAAGKSTFAVEEIKTLNRLNGKGISLPEQEVTGLKLAALLRVGEEIKPLSLPIGLSSNGDGLEEKPVGPETRTDQPSSSVPSALGTQWISIQKAFGPIHVERVGIGYQAGKIALLLDAALTAAGLTLSLDGLGAEFALKELAAKTFKPTFHLNGLGIDYRSGPLEIGGSFLEQKGKLTTGGKELDYTSYAGLAVIRTAKLTLSAIGSYTQLNDRDPSLFIYAVANYALGGPAFFYVTGFAAGFGYNRALILPPIEALASFPLVAEAVKEGGPASLPAGQQEQQKTLTDKLAQLEQFLPPSLGDIFVAAGIKFTSFKQIDSFALLVVKFGRRFEIDLLGLSTLTAPPPEAGKAVAPVAEAQLALKASFIPDEGFLGVRAQLTSNSYIFSKDCHLNGGFAFYTWFEPHRQAGDFVLTLGGYHPKFIAPDYYPQVPRLSLNWQVTSELHLKADAYFALTGSAIMAGAHLEATWRSGALQAWFNVGADFILAWKPYHYELELYIGMGVSYTFEAFGNQTLSVDLGANLHLWGPPFSGTATIHWSIISFTVNFGQGAPERLEKLDWPTFKSSFLPNSEQICNIVVQQGLVRQMKAEGKQAERWIVNPKEMVLAVNSAVPLTTVDHLEAHVPLAGTDLEKLEKKAGHLAIAPMGIESGLTSACSIAITRDDGQQLEKDKFQVRPIWKSMPAGLWGKPNLSEDKKYLQLPKLNGTQLVQNMLTGFEIRPIKSDQQPHSCSINRDELQYTTEPVLDAFAWQDFQLSGSPGQPAWDEAAKTVVGKREERDQLLKSLGMVNAVIDFGEPMVQGVLVAA